MRSAQALSENKHLHCCLFVCMHNLHIEYEATSVVSRMWTTHILHRIVRGPFVCCTLNGGKNNDIRVFYFYMTNHDISTFSDYRIKTKSN